MRSPVEVSVSSRRELLQRAAGVAGASLVPGSFLAGQERDVPEAAPSNPPGPDEPVRVGIIGTGQMGLGHAAALLGLKYGGHENLEIVALCDVCQPRLDLAHELLAERQPGVEMQTHREHAELLAREDVHAVVLALPEHWHAQLAVEAITAGKDVYLEKPMTLRLEEAFWLDEVVRANPHVRVQVGTQFVMQQKFHEARRLISEGAIGKPTLSQTSYCRNSLRGEWMYAIDEKVQPGEALDWEAWCGPLGVRDWDPEVFHRWRRYRDFSTGLVGDLLVHQVAPMLSTLDVGWPVRVSAAGGHYVDEAMENHDQVSISVEFEQDHTMLIAGSTSNELGLETLIRGHKANLFLGGVHCVLRPERIYSSDIDEETIECDSAEPQNQLRQDFLRCVRTREEVASPVSLGLRHMVVVELATRSLWERKSFAFDPETRSVAPA